MRTFLLAAEAVGTTLLMLALGAAPAFGQTLGEVTAATGIHGTLARQNVGSSQGALGAVKSSLAKSTKPRDLGFGSGSSSGAKLGSRPSSRSKPPAPGSSGARGGGSTGRGSWVTAASAGKGSASSAWLQGGSGWSTGGGGNRAPGNRRPRS